MTSRTEDGKPVKIRRARLEDAPHLAALAGQLGYPSTPSQVSRRLEGIQSNKQHAVFVAQSAEGQVVGWVHVFVSPLVESDPCAEIGGLVVDQAHRNGGIGETLMRHAEDWARAMRCTSVYLRSNVIRKQAHRFCEKLGIQHHQNAVRLS